MALVMALMMVLAACGDDELPPQAPPPEGSPGAAAIAIVTAYAAKDSAKLAEFSPEAVREQVAALKDGDELFAKVFDGASWRMLAATKWNQRLAGVRLSEDLARVSLGPPPVPEPVEGEEPAEPDATHLVVVGLRKIDDVWTFDDFKRPSIEAFAAWGEPEPEPAAEGEAAEGEEGEAAEGEAEEGAKGEGEPEAAPES